MTTQCPRFRKFETYTGFRLRAVSHIILHPETADLHARVCAMRAELADLMHSRITTTFEELPALRYRHTELFGQLEQELQRKTLGLSERKRMVELFALKLDRGQKLDKKTVELTMKVVYREFEQIRSRIVRESEKASQKAEGKGFWIPDIVKHIDPEAGAKSKRDELRTLYRTLAKRLHPDTRTGGSDPMYDTWWDLVRWSHERGDLHALRTVANAVTVSGNLAPRTETPDTTATAEPLIERLRAEEERLSALLATERERLEGIRSQEPWSIRENMEDDVWIEERREEFRQEIRAIDSETEKCDEFLSPILNGMEDQVTPETVQNIWSNFVEDVYLSGRY